MNELFLHILYGITFVVALIVVYLYGRRKAKKIVASQNPLVRGKACMKVMVKSERAHDSVSESAKKLSRAPDEVLVTR